MYSSDVCHVGERYEKLTIKGRDYHHEETRKFTIA